jgi:uncharacterized membrane protein YbhN (UPF0104 family)
VAEGVDAFLNAVEVFYDHLAAVRWPALGIAFCFHLAKVVTRTFAWRNILAASYPTVQVRRRTTFGAYVAGTGVNAILPARGGDFVKLYLVKRGVAGSTYPTLASTLLVETLFDFVVATGILVWAIVAGVLPGLDVLPHLPSIDWSWPVRHPRATLAMLGALVVLALVGWVWASRRVAAFRERVAQGFAILNEPHRYLREVVGWQALSWGFRLATVYWFLRAFRIDPTLYNTFLVQVVQSLSTVLPITPGGAGTEQGLLVYVFRGKVSATSLLSFSVGMNIALVAINVALGFGAILLMLRTLRWRRVIERDGVETAVEGRR